MRPYVVTRGRATPARRLPPETLLVAADTDRVLPLTASRQERDLLSRCRRATVSLAEAAAHVGLPVSVVSVLVCQLLDDGFLVTRAPIEPAELPSPDLISEVLRGLRNLQQ
ncbi:hypothetical protein ADK43_29890 [Streptomyces rimosus subsp. rimosus]|nr:hypothetical protein ADK43_29890 [Streptomyces rimosus subsp. rimosus]